MKWFFSCLAMATCVACSNQKVSKFNHLAGYTQGTTYSIIYKNGKHDIASAIPGLMGQFNKSLSNYDSSSIISAFNNNLQTVQDTFFIEMVRVSKKIYDETAGAFDITIAPLANAWGFGFSKPVEVYGRLIDSLLQFTGMDKINSNGLQVTKTHPKVTLISNGIAQGYLVDVISNFLEQNSINDYLVEIGGELKAKGRNREGRTWRVGIDNPINGQSNRQLFAVVKLKNRAMATSGNYRKLRENGGKTIGHIINPKTGYPQDTDILSATILAPNCIYADGLSTACMVMGFQKSTEFIKNKPDIDALFIYRDSRNNIKSWKSKRVR